MVSLSNKSNGFVVVVVWALFVARKNFSFQTNLFWCCFKIDLVLLRELCPYLPNLPLNDQLISFFPTFHWHMQNLLKYISITMVHLFWEYLRDKIVRGIIQEDNTNSGTNAFQCHSIHWILLYFSRRVRFHCMKFSNVYVSCIVTKCFTALYVFQDHWSSSLQNMSMN